MKPTIDAGLLAQITNAAPGRLVRKLDKQPTLADAWQWSSEGETTTTVLTDRGETVTLQARQGTLDDDAQIRCSCLLGPRCLHVLAVLTRLELASGDHPGADDADCEPEPAGGGPQPGAAQQVQLTAQQQQAARRIWHSAAELLEVGAVAAGAVLQAELLRAVHDCRATGLHRCASAGLRLVQGARDLREEQPEFRLADLHADMLELLQVAAALGGAGEPGAGEPEAGEVSASWCGTARRAYHQAGGLRLFGLLCEPVLARSGYGGVATYLCDAGGKLYTVVDVVPTDMQRANATYQQVTRLAEAGLTHQQLCRQGLFVQGATASADGRLGAGRSVKAVAAGDAPWTAEGPAALWSVPLADQVRRAYAELDRPLQERPAGSDLLFVQATVAGSDGPALVVVTPQQLPLRCVAATDHRGSHAADNLELLARAQGLRLLLVGRLHPGQPRTISLLAAGPGAEQGDASLRLPPEWGGRCNLGLDQLQPSQVQGLARTAEPITRGTRQVSDPLSPLGRRLQRLTLGGRATLPPEALAATRREAARLQRRMMPGAAQQLQRLHQAALETERSVSGTRRRADPALLARAFLCGSRYYRVATRALQRSSW